MKNTIHNTFTQSLPSLRGGLCCGFFLISCSIFAQEKDKSLPLGNEQFASKKFVDAESDYRISASKFKKKAIASYNLGNAIYRQNQNGEAKLAFAKAGKKARLFSEKHNAYHNLGNALMNEKKYDEAMAAYKDALRNNPEDEETRYNYALAKKMDKENPNKDKDKKKDDKKDDKKDKKDEPKDPKGDKPKPEDGKPDKPKEQPGKISEERIKNMMDAVNNEEKRVQEKVKKKQGKPVQTDKDW
jgi:tetratricopeptide (TPR) repeat protein